MRSGVLVVTKRGVSAWTAVSKCPHLHQQQHHCGAATAVAAAEVAEAAEEHGRMRPFSEVPGPSNIPFLGNFMKLRAPGASKFPLEACTILSHMHRIFGDMVRIEKMYRFVGPQPVRSSFHAFDYWRSRDPFFRGNKGLLTSQGDEWETFRKKVQQPLLGSERSGGLVRRYKDSLEDVATEFVEKRVRTARDARTNQVPDLLPELQKWALESVSCLALNVRLGCLDEPSEKTTSSSSSSLSPSEHVQILNAVSTILKKSAVLDNGLHYWRYLPSKDLSDVIECLELFKSVVMRYIGEALDDIKTKKKDESENPSLLEMLHRRGCDEVTAVTMALDLIFAGIDTTSHSAGYTMYHLARNQRVQERLHEEIAQFAPNKEGRVSNESLDSMKYLKAVVKESLRLTPAAIANKRKLVEPMELGGYLIPEGTEVCPVHYVMMNSAEHVANPSEFLPERWLKSGSGSAGQIHHPFVYLPFGHGPRMCIGRRFAELELYLFLVKIVQNFRIEWHHGDIELMTQSITYPSVPLRFTFIDR